MYNNDSDVFILVQDIETSFFLFLYFKQLEGIAVTPSASHHLAPFSLQMKTIKKMLYI